MRSATRCFPWHHELYAFLDAKRRLRDDIADKYERQANQAAIEILAQGDRLRKEADDSKSDLRPDRVVGGPVPDFSSSDGTKGGRRELNSGASAPPPWWLDQQKVATDGLSYGLVRVVREVSDPRELSAYQADAFEYGRDPGVGVVGQHSRSIPCGTALRVGDPEPSSTVRRPHIAGAHVVAAASSSNSRCPTVVQNRWEINRHRRVTSMCGARTTEVVRPPDSARDGQSHDVLEPLDIDAFKRRSDARARA